MIVIAATLISSFLSGCVRVAQQSEVIPPPPASMISTGKAAVLVDVAIKITIPNKPHPHSGHRSHYVSPATKSLAITIFASPGGHVAFHRVVNLTPTSQGCASARVGTVCSVNRVALAPASYDVSLVTYSGLRGHGSILSQGQHEPLTVAQGRLNRVPIVLYGVPASYAITPLSGAISGSQSDGFIIGVGGVWGEPQRFAITALDASQNLIAGPGAPTYSVSSSDKSFLIQKETTASTFAVSPPAKAAQEATQLTLVATSADKTTCHQSDSECVLKFMLTYAPFVHDDWITFAHDFQRTGFQTQPTGINEDTVSQLTQRWKVTLPDSVYSSPIVYNGNVIVAAYNGVLYDLSAADGSIRWQRNLANVPAAKLRGSPTVDAADGLVFMGTWNNVGQSQPSTLYALHLSDGTIAWQLTMRGMIRSAPVYTNGVLYEAWAGGDADTGCISGGISAIDAVSGTVQWSWFTNPLNTTNGGGGVWGAIGWDGSHIIFGTGNTCGGSNLAQGAVALNPDGTTAWSFQADPVEGDDNDTGGGVMIQNGTVNFMNKNGTLYKLNASTGQELLATVLEPYSGRGGFATPGSDGSTTVVGAGFFPTTAGALAANKGAQSQTCWIWTRKRPKSLKNSFSSFIKAVDGSGNVLWALPMKSSIDSYTTIVSGIAFAGLDNNMDAIGLTSGAILAQFPAADVFEAGPVVVPSGLYMADYAGDVSAFSLPTTTSDARLRH